MPKLGIDLGGTYARAGVVSDEGTILGSSKTALSDRSPEAVVDAIAQATSGALSEASPVSIDSCGVGVAGQLGAGGVVRVAPNLGWRNVPFGEMLSARLARRVAVVNDLSAAAWGEFSAGAGKGEPDLFVAFVGSGVGSAIISGGRLVNGATGLAGELGHIKVVREGRLCGCGERGCLEAYVGGHNLIAQMKEQMAAGAPSLLWELAAGDAAQLTPSLLEEAVESHDEVALSIYCPAVNHLCLAIANQITILNPGRLILGGGVLMRTPGMRARIREAVAHYSNATSRAAVTVLEAALGDDSGLIGAALLSGEMR